MFHRGTQRTSRIHQGPQECASESGTSISKKLKGGSLLQARDDARRRHHRAWLVNSHGSDG